MSDQLDCRKCGVVLDTENFWRDPSRPRGFSYWCKRCDREANRAAIKRKRDRESIPCSGCGAGIQRKNTSGKCRRCFNKGRVGTGTKRSRTAKGYRTIRVDGKNVLEHRHVYSQYIGRPLYKGENVHHKNGVRDDNRFENLELWVTLQPSGQRPEDLLAFAREIIWRYGQ